MSCLDDNCTEIQGRFPSCFTGNINIHSPDNPAADVIIKIVKGMGGAVTVALTLDGSGDGVIDVSAHIGTDFFREEAGFYAVTGWIDPDMAPIEFTDSDGGTLEYECWKFCVVNTSEYTDADWDYIFI